MTPFDGPNMRRPQPRPPGWRAVAAVAGVVAIGLFAVVSLNFQRDLAEARTATLGRSRVIDSPWGSIEYADIGSGPAVLFIHGSGGGFDQALAFGGPLAGRGVRIIAPSRFGYLRSAMPDGATPEMQADALDWLMRRLGIQEAVIFGGSAGALSATQLALRPSTPRTGCPAPTPLRIRRRNGRSMPRWARTCCSGPASGRRRTS